VENIKLLLKDQAGFDAWLLKLVCQINVKNDMPFHELLQFEQFFGIELLDNAGEPLLATWAPHNKHMKRYPLELDQFRYRDKWKSTNVPKSFPCCAVTWFERRGLVDFTMVVYVYPSDFTSD
jgi:hypothetical protein